MQGGINLALHHDIRKTAAEKLKGENTFKNIPNCTWSYSTCCELHAEPRPGDSSAESDWLGGFTVASESINDLCPAIPLEEIDTRENVKNDFTYGLAGGFLPEDLLVPLKIAYETYWVNPNEQLLFDWLFWYPQGNEEPATLRLFVLLDELQLDKAWVHE